MSVGMGKKFTDRMEGWKGDIFFSLCPRNKHLILFFMCMSLNEVNNQFHLSSSQDEHINHN